MSTTKFKSRVSYFFDEEVGIYTLKKGHPMRPLRSKITDELINVYGMKPKLQCFSSDDYLVPDKILYNFHSEEYVDLLKNINEETMPIYQDQLIRFGFSADCPVPNNSKIYDHCKLYTSGSVLNANLLNDDEIDIGLNWCGGLHHAKRQEASGFCYVNDCVLGIIELLKRFQRVLYVDIDAHHGDGVEEAFLTTDRVLTCSFHRYGDYFPGTGFYTDIGFEKGKYHAVNFPLQEGVDDRMYLDFFRPVIDTIFENFKPQAIWMQCGTDSISGDRLGCLNLSIKGHGDCLKYLKSKQVPMICVGGGGYTLRNIARCWCYETSLALNMDLDNEIPENEFSDYFYPENKLHVPISNMENMNKEEDIHNILSSVIENIKKIEMYNPPHEIEAKYNEIKKGEYIKELLKIKDEENEDTSQDK